MTVFIDIEGLTLGDGDNYATALNLTGERVNGKNRLSTLKQLRKQAFGHTIITGPTGARYWSLVPPTIRIKVVPDDYEWKQRTSDEQLWAYLALGLSDTAYYSNVSLGTLLRQLQQQQLISSTTVSQTLNNSQKTP
jgi:hypothetical protein